MEKIKQALEKARNERKSKHAVNGIQPAGNASEISLIEYTQTQSVEIPQETMQDNRIIHALDPSRFTDAVKILRTQVLQRLDENGWSTLAITSPNTCEGKTLTAVNLGISIAMEVDYTVLLVDTNLQHPNVHEYFGITSSYGLSDYLIDDVPVQEMLINPDGLDRFVLLPGGKSLMNSSEMLGSPKMSALVKELKNRYPKRIILFDLPPLLSTSDALAFIPYTDATLLVLEDDKTKTDDVLRAIDILSSTNVIGTVLNKAKY